MKKKTPAAPPPEAERLRRQQEDYAREGMPETLSLGNKLQPPAQPETPTQLIERQVPVALRLAESALAPHVSRGAKALQWAQALQIQNDQDLAVVAEDRSELKKILRNIEDLRLMFTAPINRYLRAVNDFFKQCALPFVTADGMVDQKIMDFRERQRRAAEAEQARLRKEQEEAARKEQEAWEAQERARQAQVKARLEAEAKSGNPVVIDKIAPVPPPPSQPPAPVAPAVVPMPAKSVGAMTFRSEWCVDVVDPAKLPVRYLVPDMQLIRDDVRKRGVREIPGCRIYEKEISVTRT